MEWKTIHELETGITPLEATEVMVTDACCSRNIGGEVRRAHNFFLAAAGRGAAIATAFLFTRQRDSGRKQPPQIDRLRHLKTSMIGGCSET